MANHARFCHVLYNRVILVNSPLSSIVKTLRTTLCLGAHPQFLESLICTGASGIGPRLNALVKVKFTLQQTMKAQRGTRCIALLFL
jgi:hypothetical protein